jgi:hypothetical protein
LGFWIFGFLDFGFLTFGFLIYISSDFQPPIKRFQRPFFSKVATLLDLLVPSSPSFSLFLGSY